MFNHPFFKHAQHGRKNVDASEYYDILGVPKSADPKSIRSAYRKLAKTAHPDKGGDAETFKLISEAYSVLSDKDKRKMYDQFGKDGVNGNASQNRNPFSMFFNS